MLVAFWSVKGGVGTTVSAAISALCWSASGREVLMVDLGGDVPAALGCPRPDGPGCAEWLQAGADAEPEALRRLEIPAGERLQLLPRGSGHLGAGAGADRLADVLTAEPRLVVVDCGPSRVPDFPPHAGDILADRAQHSWLVTRACYLALTRAVEASAGATGVVLVSEPGRALTRRDVADAVDARVLVEITADQSVARSVDAGLLGTRLPPGLCRVIAGVCPRG